MNLVMSSDVLAILIISVDISFDPNAFSAPRARKRSRLAKDKNPAIVSNEI